MSFTFLPRAVRIQTLSNELTGSGQPDGKSLLKGDPRRMDVCPVGKPFPLMQPRRPAILEAPKVESVCMVLNIRIILVLLVFSSAALTIGPGTACAGDFLVQPYLQLGDAPKPENPESMELLWHTGDIDARWSVEIRQGDPSGWRSAGPVTWVTVAVETIELHRVYRARMTGLRPGERFRYRVLKDGQSVFDSTGMARKDFGQSYRCVVMGDCGTNSPGQKAVAFQIHQSSPDFVLINGDIVYNDGRISEYRSNYFPIYNADQPSPVNGAPLIRSTLFLGGLGAHDNGKPLNVHPDGFGYYLYWSQPLNGPPLRVGGPNTFPLGGSSSQQIGILAATEDRYPRMANFSFDYGNTHWTILDTQNRYLDWNDPEMRRWLREDLDAAKDATWKFVSCYLPPFNSSTRFPRTEKMRIVADIFQETGVDIVFSGYAHSYQRCFPLRFTAEPRPLGPVTFQGHEIPGEYQLDRRFDGVTSTTPDGVIYLVTGAGGNEQLHSPEQTAAPLTWKIFTHTYVADTHSFTLLDVNGSQLKVRQVDKTGEVVDQFTMTKTKSGDSL